MYLLELEEKKNSVIPPGIEPGTLSVLDSRDNHYTTESLQHDAAQNQFLLLQHKCTPLPLSLAAVKTKEPFN